VVSGGNAVFSVVVSGAGPFTYQWQFNSTNLPRDIITTVAGNGGYGYSGDGGLAVGFAVRAGTHLAAALAAASSTNTRGSHPLRPKTCCRRAALVA